MRREFSAGAVIVREDTGGWVFAGIRPGGRPEGVWALPKGQIEPHESAEETALREAYEETGVQGELLERLERIEYWFMSGGERVLKLVSFYLVRYRSGELGDLPQATRHEVAETRWLPLEDGERLLSYRGERRVVARALEVVRSRHDV